VITHLFHGGNILASEKRSYADKLESSNLAGDVRSLMEFQHKAMLKRLSRGEYDGVIEQRLGTAVFDSDAHTAETLPPSQVMTQPEGIVAESPKERIARAFGDGVVSEKPLDEVVLDYLVENARKRKRSSE
jgi:hypothetical protein